MQEVAATAGIMLNAKCALALEARVACQQARGDVEGATRDRSILAKLGQVHLAPFLPAELLCSAYISLKSNALCKQAIVSGEHRLLPFGERLMLVFCMSVVKMQSQCQHMMHEFAECASTLHGHKGQHHPDFAILSHKYKRHLMSSLLDVNLFCTPSKACSSM